VGNIAVWGERIFFGRTLTITPEKEELLLRVFICMIAIGLVIEAINSVKLIKARRRRYKYRDVNKNDDRLVQSSNSR
jgi:hypothetical protein